MMGRLKGDQSQLFYEFRLDDVVPDDHLVRDISAVLDLSWAHVELAPTAVTIPLIAARAGGLDGSTDARDASTSTQRSAKRRITQRTTIAGLILL